MKIEPINTTGVTGIWGGRGSGKTTFARKHILPAVSGQRVVVIDPMSTDKDAFLYASHFADALYSGQMHLTVGTSDPDQVLPCIYAAWGHSTKENPIYIICDEAPAYFEKNTAGLSKIMFQGRHRSLGMCLIGQRLAGVTAQLRSQVERTFFLRMTGHTDLEAARKTLGPDRAALLPTLKAGEFIEE